MLCVLPGSFWVVCASELIGVVLLARVRSARFDLDLFCPGGDFILLEIHAGRSADKFLFCSDRIMEMKILVWSLRVLVLFGIHLLWKVTFAFFTRSAFWFKSSNCS